MDMKYEHKPPDEPNYRPMPVIDYERMIMDKKEGKPQ